MNKGQNNKKSAGRGASSKNTPNASRQKSSGAKKSSYSKNISRGDSFKKDGKHAKDPAEHPDIKSNPEKKYSSGKKNSAAKGGKSLSTKTEEVRLNKYLAHAGISSRREADKLIEAGLVTINGKVVSAVGTKVQAGDDVRYNGERLGNERKVYLLLNKPKDYVTTMEDPHAKKTVMDLVGKACRERIYPVGRLDRNTTGVLLFTNDGELTRKLTHPSFNKKKIYHVFLDKSLQQADFNKISEGVELEDGFIQVDALAYANRDNKKEVGLEIHSGKNRVVRRIFEHLGYKVTKLDRVYFAGLTKKNLPRGKWRFLTDQEIKMLKMNAFE